MSLTHKFFEANGQHSTLKEQKRVAFQTNANKMQFKLPKAKKRYTFIYVITKKKTHKFKLVTQSTKFKNIHPLLKSSLSELVIRGDRHTNAAKQ